MSSAYRRLVEDPLLTEKRLRSSVDWGSLFVESLLKSMYINDLLNLLRHVKSYLSIEDLKKIIFFKRSFVKEGLLKVYRRSSLYRGPIKCPPSREHLLKDVFM